MLRRTKVIFHGPSEIDKPEDESFPYRVHAELWWPDFHRMVYILRYGGVEVFIACGKSVRALNRLIREMDLRTNPRLIELTITGPDGIIERLPANEEESTKA